MLIPLASPVGLGETRVMELTPETWNEIKDRDVYYREGIDGVIRLYVPVAAILSPAVPVSVNTRHLYCDKCQKVKIHTLKNINNWNHYVCECGESLSYYVNRAPATKAM